MLIAGVSTPWLPPTPHQYLQLPVSMLCSYYDDIVVVSPRTPFRRPRASSAHSALLRLITVLDEATLAAHLRVSVPTLRRYLDRTLPMNWIIHTRLATMPELLAASARATAKTRTATPRRRKTTARSVPALAATASSWSAP